MLSQHGASGLPPQVFAAQQAASRRQGRGAGEDLRAREEVGGRGEVLRAGEPAAQGEGWGGAGRG